MAEQPQGQAPEKGIQFVLEVAAQAPVAKKYHETVEAVLGRLKRTIESQNRTIERKNKRIKELEDQIESTDE